MGRNRRQNPWFEAFGARVKAAREGLGLRQADLVERLKVDPGTVSRWEAGAFPDPPDLKRLAAVLHVSMLYLLGEESAEATTAPPATGPSPLGFIPLRRHAVQIGAGPGFVEELEEPREYQFTEAWLQRLGYASPDKAHLQVFKVAHTYGDSMEPTIRPDAILLADMGPQGRGHTKVESGRVYVLDIARGLRAQEKGLVVKRVKYQKPRGGGPPELVLWGDNRSVPPETIQLPEEYELQDIVRGLVRWVGQEVA